MCESRATVLGSLIGDEEDSVKEINSSLTNSLRLVAPHPNTPHHPREDGLRDPRRSEERRRAENRASSEDLRGKKQRAGKLEEGLGESGTGDKGEPEEGRGGVPGGYLARAASDVGQGQREEDSLAAAAAAAGKQRSRSWRGEPPSS